MPDLRPLEGAPYTVHGEGDGWLAWSDLLAKHVTITSDDGGEAKSIAIRDSNAIDDMLASAKWVAGLSETERDRALAAVECLEMADG